MGFLRRLSRSSKSKSSRSTIGEEEGCIELPLKAKRRGHQIVIVACGCFWSPQARFQKIKGVSRVIAGYAGGAEPNPSYFDIKDYTESLFVEFNPKLISFPDILQIWHDNDYPWEPESLRERSAIFVTTPEQQEHAVKFLRRLARSRPNCLLYVDLEPINVFYQAEEYQQNYVAKQCQAAKDKMIAWANNETQSGLFTIVE